MSKKVKEFRLNRVSWGSTRRLFSEAVKLLPDNRLPTDFSGIIHLNPFSAALADIQAVFQKALTGSSNADCYIPPDVSTPVVYAKKSFVSADNRTVVKNSMLPVIISRISGKGLGYSVLVTNFIHELKTHFPDKPLKDLELLFIDVFKEKDAPDKLSKEIGDVFSIIRKLEDCLNGSLLTTEDDAVNLFVPSQQFSALILEGFYAPLPSEKAVILKMCEKADNIFLSSSAHLTNSADKDDLTRLIVEHFKKQNIHFELSCITEDIGLGKDEPVCMSAEGIDEEIEYLARSIKSVYLSGSNDMLNNVIIATPDIKNYATVVERIFTRYGIPYSITSSSSALPEPFYDLVSMLRSVVDDYGRLKFTTFLSSNFFKNIPTAVSEYIHRLSPVSGVISGADSWISFINNGTDIFDPGLIPERADIHAGFIKIFNMLNPLCSIRDSAEFKNYSELLKHLIDELGFDPQNRNLQNHLAEALDLLDFTAEELSGSISLSDFIDLFEHLLKAARPESDKRGVRILDMYEAAGLCPDYLYICGMTEQNIPSLPEMDYLLPDAVKRALHLKDMDRHMEIQKTLFDMLVSSSDRVTISYPEMENDALLLQSPFLYGLPVTEHQVTGIYSETELQLNQPLEGIADNIAEILLTEDKLPQASECAAGNVVRKSSKLEALSQDSSIRVTDIDAYRTCPRKFFLEKVLKLGPVKIKKFEVDPRTIGNLSHAIMERLMKDPLDSCESFKDRAISITDNVLAGAKINDYWKEIFKDAFIRILPEIYENELKIRGENYKRSVLEMNIRSVLKVNINDKQCGDINLRGKIDRFDIFDNGVQLMDYKSGTAVLNCKSALAGKESLQLFLYAAMLKQNDRKIIKRVGIYSLNEIKVKWCPSAVKSKQKESREEMLICMSEALKAAFEVATNMRSDIYTAMPMNERVCMYCDERPFCPFINRV
ncbi:MAG: PD-(D/E)XK nuclease family protein [Dissulfurispiraceae bacterium]|jgi:ATP-dependent helicase/DNAse subunit B|nr:PD-(D/E)XK nuclease family protein [Dissulfurispiraceae bacterium]